MPAETTQAAIADAATCRTRLVDDRPSLEDEFGPHRELARAIAGLVESEDGGRALGLEGRYGAGKSTVINLVREVLSVSAGRVLWVFDAWAHDGDPLRRTFLESVIHELQQRDWIDRAEWDERVEGLRGRRKEWTTRNYPRVTRLGWEMVISILLVPLGTTLLTGALRTGFTLVPHLHRAVSFSGVIGLLLSVGPLICGGLAFLRQRRARKAAQANGREVRRSELADVFALLVQRNVSSTDTTVIETPEPTSLEFEEYFRDVTRAALETHPERRLILVIDNLDRVAPDDALGIWATLQTFIGSSAVTAPWLRQLWVIMPYDGQAISRLWGPRERHSIDLSSAETVKQLKGLGDRRAALARAFLEKTFQIRFEVPPPLLSDWRSFALRKLAEALPDHTNTTEGKEELEGVYRLFAARRGSGAASPSPREIKVFVNQLGGLHRQHGHVVPLVQMAYYTLLQEELSSDEILAGLKDGSLPRVTDASYLPEGARGALAALAFGTKPERAQQLLLEQPIVTALEDGSVSALSGVYGSGEGFWEVLDRSLTERSAEWATQDGARIFHAMFALESSQLLAKAPRTHRESVLRTLAKAAESIKKYTIWNDNGAQGAAALANVSTRIDTTRAVWHVLSEVERLRGAPADDVSAARIVNDVLAVADVMGDDPQKMPLAPILVEGEAAEYIRVLEALHNRESSWESPRWLLFAPSASVDIPTALAAVVVQGRFRAPHVAVVRTMQRRSVVATWQNFSTAALTRATNGVAISGEEVVALLDAYDFIAEGWPSGADLRRQFVVGGHAAAVFASVSDPDRVIARARLLLCYLRESPGLDRHEEVANSGKGYAEITDLLLNGAGDEIEPFAMASFKSGLHEAVLGLEARRPEARPLVHACIRAWSRMESPSKLFTPVLLQSHWLAIEDAVVDVGELVRRVGSDGSLARALAATSIRVELQRLYDAVLAADHGESPNSELAAANMALVRSLQAFARAVGVQAWVDEFERSSLNPRTLLALGMMLQRKMTVDLGPDFREALLTYARSLANGGHAGLASVVDIDWVGVHALLSESEAAVLRDQLYNLVRDTTARPSHEFFRAFGGALAGAEEMSAKTTVSNIVIPLLERKDENGLRWFLEFLRNDRKWFEKIGESHKKALKTSLKAALADALSADGAPNVAIVIRDVAEELGVTVDIRPASPPEPKGP